MILYLSFEEIAALSASAENALAQNAAGGHVAAPPQIVADLESLAHRLDGELRVTSLDDQDRMQRAVRHLLTACRAAMDAAVLDLHPADEAAVAAYFSYAHVLTVDRRLRLIGEEMLAIAQLMTGEEPDSDATRRFTFPD